MRYGYKRLFGGKTREELKRELPAIFGLNTRYVDDALLKAKGVMKSRKELGLGLRKAVFGGRGLFEQLHRRHLLGKRREKLLRRWREKRQGNLYSRGDKSKKGNLNLRFVFGEDGLYLRINVGLRRYVLARVHRKVQPGRCERDKWTHFVSDLVKAEKTGKWFPYSVELKLKDGEIYALVSFEEERSPLEITLADGAIGLDVNASPFHLAWAEVSPDGNLISHGRVDLSELIGKSKGQRDILIWKKAHEVVDLAEERGRALVIERLHRLPKGSRGDGMAELRRRLQQFAYKKLLERVEVLARRKGIEVRRVPAGWTSVIGVLKYAPQYGLDKDRAAALVIARRGLGFRERIPKTYRELLGDREFLRYALFMWSWRRQELRERLKTETNRWVRNRLRSLIGQATLAIKTLEDRVKALSQSPGSDPAYPAGTARWKKSWSGRAQVRNKGWKVLRATLVLPLLGRSFVRDYSPLRPVLVSGAWERRAKLLAPIPGVGAMGGLKIPPAGASGCPDMADNKYPSPVAH